MDWSPNTTQQTRKSRAQMLHDIRAFFLQRNVLEVETPALSQFGNTDPFIESIQCIQQKSEGSELRYLHTSPEYPMKRLLAADSGDIYQISKVWRAGESGNKHNPEFTLLEWYRVGFSYQKLMQEVEELLSIVLPDLPKKPQFKTYESLFLEKFNINPHIATNEQLIDCVREHIDHLDTEGMNNQSLLDAILSFCIEPEFESSHLTFVYDYPVSQSALAQIRQTEHYPVAERFEVYLGQSELGNGYQEEVDSKRNKQILSDENQARKDFNLETVKEDRLFLAAAEKGIPASAGVAIGLDRVLMCITGEKSIQKVINFPWDKA
ncbi:EF-P lysine aminoacylase EpmA [Cocleimonas sp. KMM 6892]|uniref:EF-P lysine aminoacylase EpmA n=1 Tax=unclassified Cocleimonas TaxID=2639732 RepID=UPI002DB99D46|nr:MULTISPECIES: EF-P lysine aminoacylase EpmA [unclassified Cocleimonas]MEB8434098.1 EF-P lysine aminoacylase EpmA [Cocleimonas sp. KMM 6892]MEC4717042.1 EF-P lysine aminoacylase EpmA [Cocleimonas sp. KMM 6895]MEC4746370.1 EF-P lysine aminoacylase EpmA [Cocleimonas sp. KMM 6896]